MAMASASPGAFQQPGDEAPLGLRQRVSVGHQQACDPWRGGRLPCHALPTSPVHIAMPAANAARFGVTTHPPPASRLFRRFA